MSTITDIEETLKHLDFAGIGLKALDIIAELADSKLGHSDARDAIRAVVASVLGGIAAKDDPKDILAEISALKSQIVSNNAAADAALDKKFGQ